jgi:hypothetical protein
VASIITIGEQAAPTQTDEATRNALNQGLTPELVNAVATAAANINTVVANAPDATTVETARFYTETTLAEMVTALYSGTMSLADFQAGTSVDALTKAIAATKLPGELIPTPVPTASSTVTPITQSSTTSSSGISHGGKVALATILPIVGVIAIVAAVAFYMSRRNRGDHIDAPAGGRVWWSSMFHRGNSSPASANTV